MRRILYRVAASLDGYIAGPRGEVDWIVHDPAVDLGKVYESVDTVLLGRRTYELTRQPGAPGWPRGWQVYAFFIVGSLGAFAYPALNGILSKMVDASRQGALQGGLGAMNSVAAILGPVIAAQSLAIGSRNGFVGAAFFVAALLIGAAAVIIAVGTAKHAPRAAAEAD